MQVGTSAKGLTTPSGWQHSYLRLFHPSSSPIILIAVFYVALHWFAPFRLNMGLEIILKAKGFISYTGMYTINGLLNHRLDVTFDAVRHLVMPVITLVIFIGLRLVGSSVPLSF